MTAITVTNGGLNLLRDCLSGAATAPQIYYVAVGTGSTAPSSSDTQLVAEVFRKAVTSFANGGSVGELLTNMYIAPGDAVGVAIAEVGFFAGPTATASANTGTLLARGLYSHTHVATESIQLQLDLTL
jgi:hypothetical protein